MLRIAGCRNGLSEQHESIRPHELCPCCTIIGKALFDRGVAYAPDYVVNGGGIINVAAEIRALNANGAYDPAWVEGKLARLMQTLDEILARSEAERRPTHEIAAEIARERLKQGADARTAA